MYFFTDDRNFGWSGAVSRNGSTSAATYNKKTKVKGNSSGRNSSSNLTHYKDFMSKIIQNSDDGKSSVIIPTTKSGSIDVDNYIANII